MLVVPKSMENFNQFPELLPQNEENLIYPILTSLYRTTSSYLETLINLFFSKLAGLTRALWSVVTIDPSL